MFPYEANEIRAAPISFSHSGRAKYCSRLIFARPEFRSLCTGTLATQASNNRSPYLYYCRKSFSFNIFLPRSFRQIFQSFYPFSVKCTRTKTRFSGQITVSQATGNRNSRNIFRLISSVFTKVFKEGNLLQGLCLLRALFVCLLLFNSSVSYEL